MNTENPFDLLMRFEQQAINSGASLPGAAELDQEWIGLGFRLGEDRLIADMSEVKEILELPEHTVVPGVKPWVVGVANVRGSLLPIVDLKGYVLGENLLQRHKGRIIVIEYKGFNTGLMVDEIFGMRHFVKTNAVSVPAGLHENLSPYVEDAYQQDDEQWPIFSFEKMKQKDDFATVSL